MKFKIDLTDKDINKIVRKELEWVISDHPINHPIERAAIKLLRYYSTKKQFNNSMVRVDKNRPDIYR